MEGIRGWTDVSFLLRLLCGRHDVVVAGEGKGSREVADLCAVHPLTTYIESSTTNISQYVTPGASRISYISCARIHGGYTIENSYSLADRALQNHASPTARHSTRFTRILSRTNLWTCRESLHGPRISQPDLWNIMVLAERFQLGVEFINTILVRLVRYSGHLSQELEM